MVREGVTQEVDVLACDLAGENVTVLLLATTEELEGVGPELQSTAEVRDESVFHRRLSKLPAKKKKKKKSEK